jgi:hypothetical protein
MILHVSVRKLHSSAANNVTLQRHLLPDGHNRELHSDQPANMPSLTYATMILLKLE